MYRHRTRVNLLKKKYGKRSVYGNSNISNGQKTRRARQTNRAV